MGPDLCVSFSLFKFFIEVSLLYNFVLVSGVQQRELAMSIHISPLSCASPHPPNIPPLYAITEHQAQSPVLCSSFPLATCFIHGCVYMSVLLSELIPLSLSPTVSTSPFSMYGLNIIKVFNQIRHSSLFHYNPAIILTQQF